MKRLRKCNSLYLSFLLPAFIIFLAGCWRTSDTYIREGNSFFRDSLFGDAAIAYENALKMDPASFKAKFNLGVAYYKMKKFREAEKLFSGLIAVAGNDTSKLQDVCYNLGNTLFSGYLDFTKRSTQLSDSVNVLYGMIDTEEDIVQKVHFGIAQDSMMKLHDSLMSSGKTMLGQSVEMYKKALVFDGSDMDAKYNLCYVRKFQPQENYYDSTAANQPRIEPTEFALMMKKQADSLVSVYKFINAWEVMDFGERKDTTVKSYNSFINKLKDVKDIK